LPEQDMMQELVAGFNQLEGPELEQAVSGHLQSVLDGAIERGGDQEDVQSALRTEWFKFSFTGVGREGEVRTQPTFLGKIDYTAAQLGVIEGNKDRVDQAESRVTAEASRVKDELLSYKDVLTTEQEKQEALAYTEGSESADNYARALAKEILGNGPDSVEQARLSVRGEFDKAIDALPEDIKAEVSHFAGSDSWVYWDLGKQKYLTDHPPVTDKDYEDRAVYAAMGIEQNPLDKIDDKFTETAEFVQRSIASRHLGWELHQMAAKGIDMSWLTQFSEEAAIILQASTKEDGQLHSWQYTELGREAQTILNAQLVGQTR